MNPLEEVGFILKDGTYKHARAPMRAMVHPSGLHVRIVYDLGEDVLTSLVVDVKNEKHELHMGLLDIRKLLEKLGV